MNISIFTENIKKICEKKGISIYKLSKLSGVGESNLSSIMNGNRKSVTTKTVDRISKALKVSPEELFKSQDNEEYVVNDLYDTLSFIFESEELKLDNIVLPDTEKEYLKIRIYEILDMLAMLNIKFKESDIDINNFKHISELHEARKKVMNIIK